MDKRFSVEQITQQVVLEGMYSDSCPVLSGVPQGMCDARY